jgi:hypothetical protein
MVNQEELLQIAARNQKEKDEAHMLRHSDMEHTQYPINSYVLLDDRTEFGAKRHKLHTPLLGPFKVLSRDKDIYTIQDLVQNTTKQVHLKALRPYLVDTTHSEPRTVALADKESFIIEKITDHYPKVSAKKFVRLPKKDIRFKVKYKGYDNEEWNSWDNLRITAALHTYLNSHGMSSLVPVLYRQTTTETGGKRS